MKLKIFALLILLAGFSYAQGYHFQSYKIEINLDAFGNSHEEIEMEMINDADYPITELEYSLAYEPKDVDVSSAGAPLEYRLEKSGDAYLITADLGKELAKGESILVKMSFTVEDFTEKVGNKNLVGFRYTPAVDTSNFNLKVSLPQGAGLVSEDKSGTPSVSPTPSKLYTDGQRIILEWGEPELDRDMSVIILYEVYGRGLNYQIALPLISGLVIGAGLVFLLKRKAVKKEVRKGISSVLSEEERKIVDIISSKEGVTQKEVIRETGFSKPKMSKIIRRLEEKGVVEKKPYHRTNKLYLAN